MKRILFFIAIALMVGETTAVKTVRLRLGDKDLYKDQNETEVSCTMTYNDLANIEKIGENHVLVKTQKGCQGWIKKTHLEYAKTACVFPRTENLEIYTSAEIADSVLAYYKDSSLYYLIHDTTKYDGSAQTNDFYEKKELLFKNFANFRDSLFRYYITHPGEPIENRDFYEKHLNNGRNDLLKIARMEWDLLQEGPLLLYTDVIFDSVYRANHKQIMDSLNHIHVQDNRLIRLALLSNRYMTSEASNKLTPYENKIAMQNLADTIARESKFYNGKGANVWNYGYVQKRQTREEHAKNNDLYLGFGLFSIHLMGKSSDSRAESIGYEFLAGIVTKYGDFIATLGGGFGINTGEAFEYEDETIEHHDILGIYDLSVIYRPNLPFGKLWSIQPEIGIGALISKLDDRYFYYSPGIRFEKSMNNPFNTLERPLGYINGWSVGVAAKMNKKDIMGIKVDLRWAFH